MVSNQDEFFARWRKEHPISPERQKYYSEMGWFESELGHPVFCHPSSLSEKEKKLNGLGED